jgi:ribonuclease T2
MRASIRLVVAAALLGLSPAPVLAASDCILDHCADQRPAPGAQPKPGGESSPGAEHSPAAPSGGGSDSRRRGTTPTGEFDFYVLSLSWSPSFCADGGAARSRNQCAPGANPGFVVHGLWPQYANGYPSQCGGNPFVPYSALSGLDGLYPDLGLARHEWRQHGVCSGKNPAGYFADVRIARENVVIPAAFKALGEDQSVAPLDVQRAFIDANPRLRPGMMAVTCRRGVLQEARICLSRDLRDFVACPQVARQGCFSQSLVIPAGR